MRTSLDHDDQQCGVVSGTLDLSDKKCSDAGRDHVCCKRPDFRIKKCDVSVDALFIVGGLYSRYLFLGYCERPSGGQ